MSEQDYINGSQQAWLVMLATCLKHLGYADPRAKEAAWIVERQEVILALRRICKDHGDNDWRDDLHLADIIDKHLARHLADRGDTR